MKIVDFTISGTVTSGHPTRTTFGNTLRVVHYYKYALFLAGITKYKMYVGGDDFFIMLLEKDKDIFIKVC